MDPERVEVVDVRDAVPVGAAEHAHRLAVLVDGRRRAVRRRASRWRGSRRAAAATGARRGARRAVATTTRGGKDERQAGASQWMPNCATRASRSRRRRSRRTRRSRGRGGPAYPTVMLRPSASSIMYSTCRSRPERNRRGSAGSRGADRPRTASRTAGRGRARAAAGRRRPARRGCDWPLLVRGDPLVDADANGCWKLCPCGGIVGSRGQLLHPPPARAGRWAARS